MATIRRTSLINQTLALAYKSFLVAALRRPIPFLIVSYIIPIGLLGLLLAIPYFTSDNNTYGVSNVAPLPSLASTITDQTLIFVRPSNLGTDVDDVIRKVSEPLPQGKVRVLDSDQDLVTVCLANSRGVSACQASISFYDSPLTQGSDRNHTWNYTMRGDPARQGSTWNIELHDSDQERRYMPLQLAVENAMMNSTIQPMVIMYTGESPDQAAQSEREGRITLVAVVYPFALFGCYFAMVSHLASAVCRERESGISHLVDAMGGSPTARVLSYLIVFNLVYLPVWIVSGILYGRLLFPTSNMGIFVLWQILTGLAVNSSTVFAAAFFSKARVSAIYVIGAFLLFSIIPEACGNGITSVGVIIFALLFPSSNYFYFINSGARFQVNDQAININEYGVQNDDLGNALPVNAALLWVFLACQIIIYGVLAVLIERSVHGINFKKREFTEDSESTSSIVIKTSGLRKIFQPSWTERIFCLGRKQSVLAVDRVSLEGHRGQILCLVGPNGSGKTTTLQMIAGFLAPTGGAVTLNALPSQLGICPQQNTLWDELTVKEHIRVWNQIKSGQGDPISQEQLIASCSLEGKINSQAGTLSGGQKRKLQLACMFVGDSSVCLIDECTSGLDPLSRRAIWDILMEQRVKRSIILTTHFLDEVEVLADHVVILTKGSVKCQGPTTELKHLHGGGYRVLVPRSAPRVDVSFPVTVHQDHVVYVTPDSRSAAEFALRLSTSGVSGVSISGPQVEDVFLNVANDTELSAALSPHVPEAGVELSHGIITSFWAQVGALLWKRFRILKRFWWPYLYVLVIPLVVTPFLGPNLLENFQAPSCALIPPVIDQLEPVEIFFYDDEDYISSGLLLGGPQSSDDALFAFMNRNFSIARDFNMSFYNDWVQHVDSMEAFLGWLSTNASNVDFGLYVDPTTNTNVVAYDASSGIELPVTALNLFNQLQSGIQVVMSYGTFAELSTESDVSGVSYAVFFTLVQAIWPIAFALYPAIESQRKVRALEYANGVRRAPLWFAYILFDTIFIFIISLVTTVIVAMPPTRSDWNGPTELMLPILFFYGLAATLIYHIVTRFCKGPLSAFFWCLTLAVVSYAATCIGFAVASTYSDPGQISRISDAVTFSLNLLFPIGNVFRATLVGLNVRAIACNNGTFYPSSSIYAYGGPILYLIVQVVALFTILLWLEKPRSSRKLRNLVSSSDAEKSAAVSASVEVVEECHRVESSEDDLLRILHLTKSFGSNTAVDNVTFGLGGSEVMALIGPNGAGKSTLVNLIRAELSPDSGEVFLRDENAFSASAQKHLGVCPQYDALDLLNTREHLMFYAKIKGIKDVNGNVNTIMAKLGLSPHASQAASKLSGGNKRKLSLAIALTGTPPVLVLDEPTSAMDAVAKRAFWKIIQEISPNRSLLLTTHSMEEADTLANRAAIISKRLLAVGTTQALREKYSNVYYVQLLLKTAPHSTNEEMQALSAWVQEAIPGAALERKTLGGQVRFTIPGSTNGDRNSVVDLIQLLEKEKDARGVEYYSIGGATLERVFLSVVRGNNVDEEDGSEKRRRFGKWDLGI